MSRPRRSILRRCTLQARACSWSRARSSAAAHSSARRSFETHQTNLHLQVDDIDAWWTRAVAAGAEIVMPLALQFWGDRYGQIRDPFGVLWAMGSSSR